jgi:hypothetical protein
LSDASGHIGYATIDLGYNFLRAPGAKVGAFVGYNYYAQAINTFGCTQLAGDKPCAEPPRLLGLTENDHFNSLRIGLSSEVMLTDRLRLTGDAAFVPWVTYSGLDNHLQRQLLGPNASNSGTGVMLEAVLDYQVTDAWSIGVGGRYWAWQMDTGTAGFVNLTNPAEDSVEPQRASTERYGIFVQSSYRWGNPALHAEAPVLPTKAPALAVGPMNWSGFYVGGYLGGGRSDGRWSDPFESTDGANGAINVAGFGNKTIATGPLGGGQIGANWQGGPWVLGVQADLGAGNIRGEGDLLFRPGRHQLQAHGRCDRDFHRPGRLCMGPHTCLRQGWRRFKQDNLRSARRHKRPQPGDRHHHPEHVGLGGWRRNRICTHQPVDGVRRIRPHRPSLNGRSIPDRRHYQCRDHQGEPGRRPLQARGELQV